MHHAIGFAAVIGLIVFAFGQRAAQAVAGAGLILAGSVFAYIAYRTVFAPF
jgi:hypothetical protein